ncbi:MAG TPA: hypothetical protein VFW76_02420 [Ktedonobacterales bacterium]|nr:hypothetical protein [Ktedonobacterales bacterium]
MAPTITQRCGEARSVTRQTTLPRRPATRNRSVTSSPTASEWSAPSLTPSEEGCHSGQWAGVVT